MAELSNEILMAFADGELDRAEYGRVAALLAASPELRRRLEVFEQTGKSAFAEQFRGPFLEPAPRHLVSLVLNSDVARPIPARAQPGSVQRSRFVERLRNMFAVDVSAWQLAAASTATLIVGLGLGWFSQQSSVEPTASTAAVLAFDNGRITAAGALQQVLETTATNRVLPSNDAESPVATARIRLTFKSRQQDFCRQYELALRDGNSFAGIGCRAEDGKWQVHMHVPVATRSAGNDKTVPASSGGPAALAAVVDRLIEGDALGISQEAELLGRHWRK